jgi:hypothetical protein
MLVGWLRVFGERYLYSREYVTHAVRLWRQRSRVSPKASEQSAFYPANRHDRTGVTDIAHVLNLGELRREKRTSASGSVMDINWRFRNNPAPYYRPAKPVSFP